MALPHMNLEHGSVRMYDMMKRNLKGVVRYRVYSEGRESSLLLLPGNKQIERLAKKFLREKFVEMVRRTTSSVEVYTQAGTSPEDRAAFLAAVATHARHVRK